ncbi:MAG: DUF4190 domain-containing protein [bacterium]
MTQKCDKCGEIIKAKPIDAGRTGECPGCGAPILVSMGRDIPPALPSSLPAPVTTEVQTSGFAIASLVLGILSIVPGVYLGGIVMGILAIVFSRMAVTRIKAQPGVNGQGLATAGLVTGIIGLSLSVFVILIFGAIAGIGLAFLVAIFKALMAGMPQ